MMAERSLAASVQRLQEIMSALRVHCPFDRVQTKESLRRYLIEECHEVLEAIDAGDSKELCGELGDLLFQIWFHAEVQSEAPDGFDLIDVLEGTADKLVRRHPHVFGEGAGREFQIAELRGAWERSKRAEGRKSLLDGVPPLLPALLLAERYQEKAASVGFDWPDARSVLDKVSEEVAELREALEQGKRAASSEERQAARAGVEAEFGDLLFTLVNYARKEGLVAEDALRLASRRFRARIQHMEAAVLATAAGESLADRSAAELEALWALAKEAEGRHGGAPGSRPE